MAGYRIEYTGGAVERKNVPEVTVGNSLTIQSPVAGVPVSMEGNASPNVGTANYGFSPYPGASDYRFFSEGGNPGLGIGGGIVYVSIGGGGSSNIFFVTPQFSAQTIVTIRGQMTNGTGAAFLYHSGLPDYTQANGSTLWNLNGTGGVTFYTISYTIPANRYFIMMLSNMATRTFGYDYIRFTQSAPVSLDPFTFQNGVNPLAGSPVTTDVTTYQSGTGATAGVAKSFGVDVNHDGVPILKPRYFPPADTSESAIAKVSQVKIITANQPDIEVVGTGLGGPEKLRALDTRILVEEYDGSVEN